jgi:ketosteroid isomerase-like protein
MARFLIVALGITTIAASACVPTPTIDVDAETAQLRAAAQGYHGAAQALNADAISALYTVDAVAYPPNEPTVEGQAGFREYAAGFVSVPGIQMRFTLIDAVVSAAGDMGYTYADAEITVDGPDGEPVTENLRDFHVWTKNADGAWRIVVDIWNSPDPLPGND